MIGRIIYKFKTNKFYKKILLLLILNFVFSFFFNFNLLDILSVDSVFAQTDVIQEAFVDKIFMMNGILKILYILLRPLLVIAGLSLDNSLVYGSFFNLDVPLWQFWNIVKNFANFALGFLVLFEILRSIFSGFDKESATGRPMKIIKNALIAGVLIQSSWFILGAVIDVSTIATVAIGGMPMSVLGGSKLGDKPILTRHSNFKLDSISTNKTGHISDNLNIWYSYNPYSFLHTDSKIARYIAKCKIIRIGHTSYIVGRVIPEKAKGINYKDFAGNPGTSSICVYSDKYVVVFKEIGSQEIGSTTYDMSVATTTIDYNSKLNAIISSNEAMSDTNILKWISDNNIVKIDGNMGGEKGIIATSDARFADYINKGGMTLSTIVSKLKNMTGPLITLYSSILNFAEISDVDMNKDGIQKTQGGVWTELLIKAVFALALLIPLAVLAIVLIARVGYIWLIIAFIPLIILKEVFDLKLGSDVDDKIPKVGDILGVIFSPVITVFALSVSLIFLTAINTSMEDPTKKEAFFKEFDMTQKDGETNFGIVTLKSDDLDFETLFSGAKDLLSWLLVNLFAVGIIWAILFAAIKANKLGKAIVSENLKGIDSFLPNMAKSLPIWTTRDGTGVSLKSVQDVSRSASGDIVNSMTLNQARRIQDIFNVGGNSTTYSDDQMFNYHAVRSHLGGNNLNNNQLSNYGFNSGLQTYYNRNYATNFLAGTDNVSNVTGLASLTREQALKVLNRNGISGITDGQIINISGTNYTVITGLVGNQTRYGLVGPGENLDTARTAFTNNLPRTQ